MNFALRSRAEHDSAFGEDAQTGPLDHLKRILKVGPSDESPADQFASWLPYISYIDKDEGGDSPIARERDVNLFINREGIGFMLEVMPQSGADERMVEVLLSLYSNCPKGTGVQYHLFASPHVRGILRRYANRRVEDSDQREKADYWGRPARNENLFRTLARRRFEHLTKGALDSLTKGFHFSIRDFRLMVSVTVPGDPSDPAKISEVIQLRDGMSQTLKSANFPNVVCDAADLINWVRLFTNPDLLTRTQVSDLQYDDGREIRDQVVDHDTIQDAEKNELRLWKEDYESALAIRFFSVKSFPQRFSLWRMGALIGDLMQGALQYPSPFLLTMGVHVLDPNTTRTQVTANHIRATQNAESKMARVMPDTTKKAEDWTAAANVIDAGGALVTMYHQLALLCEPRRAVQVSEAAKAIWRNAGFELNADTYMQRQALLASLPMTLSSRFHDDLKKMRRVSRKTNSNAVHLAPLMTEWRGTPTETMVFAGRRGQLMTLDLYDNTMGNSNAAIIGAPGSGKSVLMNEIAVAYRATNAQVWILDLGRSFEKLCQKAGGLHIEFTPSSDICLNPFGAVTERRWNESKQQHEGGIEEDIDMLKPALAKMCSMSDPLDEVQRKALGALTLKLYRQYGREMTVTALRDACRSGTVKSESSTGGEDEIDIKDDQRIKDLAVMLNPYSRGGEYERFFEGRNTVDFSNDFIVIENEELKRKPELHAVVNILLMYQITGRMYLDRSRKKLLMIDELKQQLGDIGSDDPVKAAVVEEAARRARKYGGSLVTATQSGDDYFGSKQMEAALSCSDWLFMLRQKPESIELLARQGKISMDEGKKRLLQSLRMEKGVFSEVYITSPVGEGVARVVLDPYTQLLFSNTLDDNRPIDQMRAQGMSIDEAILELLRQRGVKL
jgi:conjugal transfer ATP-binding protein TraC